MKSRPFSLVLFGAPGCGKGTQAELIAEHYGFAPISTGSLFRQEIAHKTPLGIEAKTLIDAGQLCPDTLTLNMLRQHLQQLNNGNGFILDGVPRTIKQAQMMDGKDFPTPIPVSLVIYIKVNEAEIFARLSERAKLLGRSDDTPEVIKQRIATYLELTKPLKKYYAEQGKLVEINGLQTIEQVFQDICKEIDIHL